MARALYDVPGEAMDTSAPSWRFLDERFVLNGGGIERKVIGANQSYIFNKNQWMVGSTLSFVISDLDEEEDSDDEETVPESSTNLPCPAYTSSLTFGVTTIKPNRVVIEELPSDPKSFFEQQFSDKWFVVPDLVPPPVSTGRFMSLRRNPSGITIKTEKRQINRILNFPADKRVYPFFYFSGKVRKISVVSDSPLTTMFETALQSSLDEAVAAAPRTRNDSESSSSRSWCVICIEDEPTHAIRPCGHIVYCMTCADYAREHENVCPICRGPVEGLLRLYRP